MVNVKKNLIGNRFGKLTVLEQTEDYIRPDGTLTARWKCQCDCGNIIDVCSDALITGNTKSCGCSRKNKPAHNRIDLTGQKFNSLLVLEQDNDYCKIHHIKSSNLFWKCKCDCGNIVSKKGTDLRSGKAKKCHECMLKEQGIRHRKHNKFDLSRDYGIGYANNTQEQFYFDLEDYDILKEYSWIINNKGYCITGSKVGNSTLRMHRLIMNLPPLKSCVTSDSLVVDHINGNKKDNRKANLRIVSPKDNGKNIGLSKNNQSGVTGVTLIHKWVANITVNNKHIHLGYFDNIEDAIKARKEAEEKYFGEYARKEDK